MPAKRNARTRPNPHEGPRLFFQSVAVVVADRKKAKRWYSEILGLDVLDDEDHWLTVGRKGHEGRLHLCQTTEYQPGAPLEPGNTGVLLLIPGDFAKECARLKSAGVEFTEGPDKASWGWYAVIRDPDGNEFALGPVS